MFCRFAIIMREYRRATKQGGRRVAARVAGRIKQAGLALARYPAAIRLARGENASRRRCRLQERQSMSQDRPAGAP
jgi:hypothetical protein